MRSSPMRRETIGVWREGIIDVCDVAVRFLDRRVSALFFAAVCALSSCKCPLPPEDCHAMKRDSSYPQSATGALSHDGVLKYERFLPAVPEPHSPPYPGNAELSGIYAKWYRSGYAYVLATENRHLGNIAPLPTDTPREAMLNGWYDGNADAALHLRKARAHKAAAEMLQEATEAQERNGDVLGK